MARNKGTIGEPLAYRLNFQNQGEQAYELVLSNHGDRVPRARLVVTSIALTTPLRVLPFHPRPDGTSIPRSQVKTISPLNTFIYESELRLFQKQGEYTLRFELDFGPNDICNSGTVAYDCRT